MQLPDERLLAGENRSTTNSPISRRASCRKEPGTEQVRESQDQQVLEKWSGGQKLKTHKFVVTIWYHQHFVTIWYHQHRRRSVWEVGLTFFYGMCGPRLTIRDHSKDWEAARGRPTANPPLLCSQKITMTTAPTWSGQPTPFSFINFVIFDFWRFNTVRVTLFLVMGNIKDRQATIKCFLHMCTYPQPDTVGHFSPLLVDPSSSKSLSIQNFFICFNQTASAFPKLSPSLLFFIKWITL